jgi:mono/diheme cytochrome c family protein
LRDDGFDPAQTQARNECCKAAGMPSRTSIVLCLPIWVAACSSEPASTVPADAMADPGRGELLYQTACAACHTVQAHWRDKSVVHSWGDLVYQVARWQKNAGQSWRAEDIEDVAAYLNRRFYHLPCPLPGCAADRIGSSPAGR